MAVVLVVDDNLSFLRWACDALEHSGHVVMSAASAGEALQRIAEQPPDLALIDLVLPDLSGLQLFEELRRQYPDIPAMMVTGNATIESAVSSMKAGMAQYLEKPIKLQSLLTAVDGLLAMYRRVPPIGREGDMVGCSSAMMGIFEQVRRVAPLDISVLIEGETGTGKELIARAIHAGSSRAAKPFIDVNCSAVPTSLFESEFFGHEKGAFTDARERRIGLLQLAHHGTLFLDEVGDLAPEAQAKLLRVLEQRQVVPLGGHCRISVDVRIVAATNVDLNEASAAGRFRLDLLYRLKGYSLHVPPLRRRRNDIPALVDHLLPKVAERVRLPAGQVTAGALEALVAFDWPGNARQLEQALTEAILARQGTTLRAADLPAWMYPLAPAANGASPPITSATLRDNTQRLRADIERQMIQRALRSHHTLQGAAAALGIDRKTLWAKRTKYGI